MKTTDLTLPSNPAQTSTKRAPLRFWIGLICVAGLIAAGYGIWSWQQWNRPGMRHYLQGMEYASQNSYSSAEREWLLGVREDPTFADNHERLGDLYSNLLRHPEAAKYYETASRLAPDNGENWKKLAKMQRQIGEDEKSFESAARAAALLTDDAEVQGEYGILAAGRQSRGAALKALRRAHELKPDEHRYLTALVAVHLDGDDLINAESTLAPYLSRHPDDGEANFLMAEIYNHKPRTTENVSRAISYAERALKANNRKAQVYSTLGQLYLDSQQIDKALKTYQEGSEVDPSNVALVSGMMQCYARQGNQVKHRAMAAKVQEVIARQDLKTRLRHTLGFKQADVDTALQLGRIYEIENDYANARTAYDHAVQYSPNNQRAVQARNEFYQRLNVLLKRQNQANAQVSTSKSTQTGAVPGKPAPVGDVR